MAITRERNAYPDARHHPHLDLGQVVQRYPVLVRNLQAVLCGTVSEAACVIRDYRDGFNSSCEACSHSGLTPLHRIESATAQHFRHMMRKERKKYGNNPLTNNRPAY